MIENIYEHPFGPLKTKNTILYCHYYMHSEMNMRFKSHIHFTVHVVMRNKLFICLFLVLVMIERNVKSCGFSKNILFDPSIGEGCFFLWSPHIHLFLSHQQERGSLSSNSEALTSELLENLEETFLQQLWVFNRTIICYFSSKC